MTRAIRRGLTVVLLTAAVSAFPANAHASPPETETVTGKDSETFIDVAPSCGAGGAPLEITIDYNFVEHSTVSDEGTHVTFTQTGTFVAVALDPAGQDASGHFTQWGGFNENPGGAVNGTFTFSVRGRLEDGTRIRFHLTDHFNFTPTGASNFFTLCRD
jgi:hypothetical protein